MVQIGRTECKHFPLKPLRYENKIFTISVYNFFLLISLSSSRYLPASVRFTLDILYPRMLVPRRNIKFASPFFSGEKFERFITCGFVRKNLFNAKTEIVQEERCIFFLGKRKYFSFQLQFLAFVYLKNFRNRSSLNYLLCKLSSFLPLLNFCFEFNLHLNFYWFLLYSKEGYIKILK